MRRTHVATALVVLSAAVTASAAVRRLAARRRPAAAVRTEPAAQAPDTEAVVLAFPRRAVAAPAPERPTAPARCGDSGGRTKAGAPCGARATSAGRCHHHRVAA